MLSCFEVGDTLCSDYIISQLLDSSIISILTYISLSIYIILNYTNEGNVVWEITSRTAGSTKQFL